MRKLKPGLLCITMATVSVSKFFHYSEEECPDEWGVSFTVRCGGVCSELVVDDAHLHGPKKWRELATGKVIEFEGFPIRFDPDAGVYVFEDAKSDVFCLTSIPAKIMHGALLEVEKMY